MGPLKRAVTWLNAWGHVVPRNRATVALALRAQDQALCAEALRHEEDAERCRRAAQEARDLLAALSREERP